MDARYQIELEYCGYSVPMFVSRFCGDMIGASPSKDKAEHVVETHQQEREAELSQL